MNSADKQAVLHCLKSMIDEEVCEECPLYGTTGTDHCEKDCVRLAINALSSSEKPNKWIPCSERLPEEDGEYLATIYDMDENYEYIDIAELEDGKWCYKPYILVKAWMPLPEPYQPEIPTGAERSDKE